MSNRSRQLEDEPALGIEPFTIDQVYIETDVRVLPWARFAVKQSSGPASGLIRRKQRAP